MVHHLHASGAIGSLDLLMCANGLNSKNINRWVNWHILPIGCNIHQVGKKICQWSHWHAHNKSGQASKIDSSRGGETARREHSRRPNLVEHPTLLHTTSSRFSSKVNWVLLVLHFIINALQF
jgi:hypothetical protein